MQCQKNNMNNIKLDPKCFSEMPMAVTNDNLLLPCCFCDTPVNRTDPLMQDLLRVSKIKNYSSLDEIVETDEWIQFSENLKNNIGPVACKITCAVRDNQNDIVRKCTIIDPDTGEERIKRI